MGRALIIVILISSFQSALAQYETGGRQNLNEFTDLFSGPNPKWQPKGNGYAFLNETGLIIRTQEGSVTLARAQNRFEWSHDGNSLIYTAKDSIGNLKIFQYFLTDKRIKLISIASNWSDFYPAISPNDSIICYYSAKDEPFKLYYIKSDVTRKIVAHSPSEEYLHPKWSPKGKFLLYFKHQQPNNPIIEIMEFATKKVIFSLDGNKFDFHDWSPDETEILVRENITAGEGPNYYKGRLVRINISSKESVRLTRAFSDLFAAEWSDTNKIVFCANQTIYAVDYTGENMRKIFKGGNFPNVDPDGQKIIFVRNKKGIPVYEIRLDRKDLKLLEPTTFTESK
jgi:Tol biopolymer transport system component